MHFPFNEILRYLYFLQETNKKLFFSLDDEAKNVRPLLRETAIYFYLGAAAG